MSCKTVFIVKTVFLTLVYYQLYAQNVTYTWPILPINPGGTSVISGFCAYRPDYYSGGSFIERHFHGGVDIPEGSYTYSTVFTVTLSFEVVDIGGDEGNKWIKVRHYYDSLEYGEIDSGSLYLHLINYNESLQEGGVYVGEWLADGDDLYSDHLHFDYRVPYDLQNYENSFMIDALDVDDNVQPTLCNLYVDNITQGNADVVCWEYLGSNFSQYYDSVTAGGIKFYKLDLPNETPQDDWDDPHIILTGNRIARFVIEMFDINTAVSYHYQVTIDTSIVDLAGSGYTERPVYEARFDLLDGIDYDREEAVYHQEDPIVSDWTSQYYRLYLHGQRPSVVLEYSTTLETEDQEEGQHRIRITVADFKGNDKTADVHFYIKETSSNWVDYCRAFTD